MRLFRCIFSVCIVSGCCTAVHAQYEPPGDIYPDAVMADGIKTVRLYKDGWEISYPVRNINDERSMVLTFDELGSAVKSYAYRIVHCDAEWKRSRLIESDYLEGFSVNYTRHYDYSFNTAIPYVHYRIPLPNEDISLKLSGNYVIIIYEEGKEEYPILCKRFSVTESVASVQASAVRPRLTAHQDEWQQVELLVRTVNYPVENPYQDMKIVILKNGQWHNAVRGIKPLFVRQNELDYRQEKAGLFPAGNEYRPLDLKSLRYASTPVSKIDFGPTTYHFYLQPDAPRRRYLFKEDFNGRYAIQSEKTDRYDVACEYVYAHFSLKTSQPFDDGQVYVCGSFCNDNFTEENRMIYNADKGQYEASILLKQGYYNYQYVFLPFDTQIPDEGWIEGNFSDTENDYLIYVYHKGRLSRYDRLIGVTTVNSLYRNQ